MAREYAVTITYRTLIEASSEEVAQRRVEELEAKLGAGLATFHPKWLTGEEEWEEELEEQE